MILPPFPNASSATPHLSCRHNTGSIFTSKDADFLLKDVNLFGGHLPLRLRSACRAAPGTSSSVSMKAAQHSAAHDCPTQRAAECPLRLHRPRNGNCSLFEKDKTDSMQDCFGQGLCRIFQHLFPKEKSRSLMGELFYTDVLIHCRSEAALRVAH